MEKQTVLIVDDGVVNRILLRRLLEPHYNILEAEDGSVAWNLLLGQSGTIAAVLLDIVMPVMDGYELLARMQESGMTDIPVIVTTSTTGIDDEKKALDAGAWDFVTKPYNANILYSRLRNAIARSKQVAFDRLKYVSEHDELTGLYNRRMMFSETKKMIESHPDRRFVFIRFDIDHFALYNTSFGEKEGNRLLQYVATYIEKVAKLWPFYTFSRIAADIFCFCGPYSEDEEFLTGKIEEIQDFLMAYRRDYRLKLSAGICIVDDPTMSVDECYFRATVAAQKCKNKITTPLAFYDAKAGEDIAEEVAVANDMQAALDEHQFEMYFQPKFSLPDEKVCGSEALVRWRHPVKGLVPPGSFIPVFEKNGSISKLDYYVWEETCRILNAWQTEGKPLLPVSVNISRISLYNPQLTDIIVGLTKKYDISPSIFQLEITESAYMTNPELMENTIDSLHSAGFTILMDDFGSGYSSLNTLKRIHVDILKVDMKFLPVDDESGRGEIILSSVIRMAGWLGMRVVVEGVETRRQRDFLEGAGCDYIQGYYYSKPIPRAEYEEKYLLARNEDSACLITREKPSIAPQHNMTILVIDDSEIDRAVLKENFQDLYNIHTCDSAEAGLAYLCQNSSKVRLIIVDNLMPGMSGLEFLQCCQQDSTLSAIPKIMITANNTIKDQVEAFKAGAYDYITKPFVREIVAARIDHIMEFSRSSISVDSVERNRLFDKLLSSINGGVAIYKLTDGNAKAQYISESAASILGLTAEKYMSLYGDDIISSIYKEDRAMMLRTVRSAFNDGTTISITYRSPHKNGGYVWINGIFSRYNTLDSDRYLRAIFIPTSQQFETQIKILDQTENGIYITDSDTYELYYCNNPGFDMLGVAPCDYTGKTCYEVMHHRSAPCEFCKLSEAVEGQQAVEVYTPDIDRTFKLHAKNTEWNGKSAVIQYMTDITEEKRTQQELKRSEKITEAASDFAGMWLWIYDIKNDSALTYKRLQHDFGLPQNLENYPESWLKLGFIAPEHELLFRDSVRHTKEGTERVEFDCKVSFLDRSEHWVRCRFNILAYENDTPTLAICTAQPIDVEKALEARVELEQKKPFANQKALIAYSVINLSTNTVISHKEMRETPYSAEAGMPFDEAIRFAAKTIRSSEERELFIALHDRKTLLDFYEHGGTSNTFEFQRIFPSGEVLWVKNTLDVLRNPATQDIYLYEYSYDNDENKKSRIALESLIDDEIDFVTIVNLETQRGRLVRSDSKLQVSSIWQDYDHNAAMEKLISINVVKEDREKCRKFYSLESIKRALATESSANIVYQYAAKDGRILRKRSRVFYLDDYHEDIVIVRRDVTDLYEEEQKQKKEFQLALDAANAANKAKSEFLSQMSHEIRTPMNAIIGMTKLAEEEAVNPRVLDYLKKIDDSSDYLLGILNDVLDMSRIENGKLVLRPEWCSAAELLDECISMVRPTADAKHIRLIAPSTEPVRHYEYYVDPLRTKQILMNLLNNAVKFTPEGGCITLKAHTVFADESLSVEQMSISDTGYGMSEEFLRRIFCPFEQERSSKTAAVQGTGLGLALVKSILAAMGGDISVTSELGKGSCFVVTFPHKYRLAKSEQKAAPDNAAEKFDFSGKRVLLVDDHPLNREVAKRLLEKKNITVALAANGKEALERFEASPVGYFDAILMDIRMPLMNGLEATQKIRALSRPDAASTAIIAMTANAFDDDALRSKAVGMNAHLAKPIDPQLLYRTLAEHIGLAPQGGKAEK